MKTVAAAAVAVIISAVFIGVADEPASALAVYDVTTTDDHDDDVCDADCTLREAVNEAAEDADASEIQLDVGNYVLDDCAAGDLDHAVDEDLTITGAPSTITQTCADRVFEHDGSSLVTLDDLFVTGGEATNAGGGVISLVDGGVTVVDTYLALNEATNGGSGGAIDVLGSEEDVTIVNSTIRDNIASDTGGAIRNTAGTVVVENSTISGNSGAASGAIDGGTVVIENSTITGNVARDGAIGGVRSSADLDIRGSTIVDNRAVAAPTNVLNGDELTVTGSIIAEGHGGRDCDGSQLRQSGGYNVGGDNSCGLDEPTDVANVGNPRLGPLTLLSGDNFVRVPLAGSPAADLVPNAVCVGAEPPVFTSDQRGVARPRPTGSSPCDAGAVEGNDDDTAADALVKRPGKPMVGAGVFSETGVGQKASQKKPSGKTATYTVRARNGSPIAANVLTVGASPSIGPFSVKYFVGTTNVTGPVTANTYETGSLAAGASESITVKVKVKGAASPGDKLVLLVGVNGTAGIVDAVKTITKAK